MGVLKKGISHRFCLSVWCSEDGRTLCMCKRILIDPRTFEHLAGDADNPNFQITEVNAGGNDAACLKESRGPDSSLMSFSNIRQPS